MHLIYRSKHYETQSKVYEFSRRSMVEHWNAGVADMARTLADPRWAQRDADADADGVRVFDIPAADVGQDARTTFWATGGWTPGPDPAQNLLRRRLRDACDA